MAFEPGRPVEPSAIFTSPQGETARLPKAVADKVFAIRDFTATAHRAMPEFAERQAANGARGDAERRLARLLAHPHQGGFRLAETDARVIAQRRLVAELTAAAQRLHANYEGTSRVWQAAARTRGAIEEWLRSPVPGTAIEAFDGPAPQLAKGENILGAVARLERRCRELRADVHRIESAPLPSSYARERLREIVATWARAGSPNVSMLIEHEHGEISWPTRTLQSTIFNAEGPRPIAFAEIEAVIPMLAWLFGDLLTKRLDTMIAEEADDSAALSIPDRQRQAAQVQSDLLAAERNLCWFVWRGLDDRLPVWFDGDISPAAIIGAQITTPLAVNGDGTSPQHTFDVIGR